MSGTHKWSELAKNVSRGIDLVVVTNGRTDCISQTIPSARQRLVQALDVPFNRKVMIDDSGDHDYQIWLSLAFPDFWPVYTEGKTGFDGAYRKVWEWCRQTSASHVFVLEDDFTFNVDIDLTGMRLALDLNPHLAQIALVRQPWNDREEMAGGVREQWPDSYVGDELPGVGRWLEHTISFTTNPFMARTALMKNGPDWPTGSNSEGRYGFDLRREGFAEIDGEDVRFAYWGWLDVAPQVHHIGHTRVGSGY